LKNKTRGSRKTKSRIGTNRVLFFLPKKDQRQEKIKRGTTKKTQQGQRENNTKRAQQTGDHRLGTKKETKKRREMG
jgi:hypothetical protein